MADATFEELIGTLNDLIETCRDGINGFRTAADGVSSPIAKEVFLSRVHLIEKGLGDLDAAVQRLGGDPIEHGHPGGVDAPGVDQHQVGRHDAGRSGDHQ
jgi:hypothetical protein